MTDHIDQLRTLVEEAQNEMRRPTRGLWLCKFGLHLSVFNEKLYIAHRKRDWSSEPDWYFQVKVCTRCGRTGRRWVGEVRTQ